MRVSRIVFRVDKGKEERNQERDEEKYSIENTSRKYERAIEFGIERVV